MEEWRAREGVSHGGEVGALSLPKRSWYRTDTDEKDLALYAEKSQTRGRLENGPDQWQHYSCSSKVALIQRARGRAS